MPNVIRWARHLSTTFFQNLFDLLTRRHQSALITRIALAFLNVWQAFVMYNHNFWIPNLVAPEVNIRVYIIYSVVLAVLSTFSVFNPSVWLAAIVLAVNSIQYLYIGVASLWFRDPPRAGAGLTLFVSIICVAGFWRVLFLIIRQYRRPKR